MAGRTRRRLPDSRQRLYRGAAVVGDNRFERPGCDRQARNHGPDKPGLFSDEITTPACGWQVREDGQGSEGAVGNNRALD